MTDIAPQDGAPVIVNDNGQAPGVTVPGTAPAEEAWWKEASEKHGFKSKEDVYKSWSESTKKISDQGEELKNFKIFQEQVVPVLDIVLKDEEILKQVRGKMDPDSVIPPKSPAIDNSEKPSAGEHETKQFLISNIASSFETAHGIDKMDPDTQKEIKAKIGLELSKFTSKENMNLNSLPSQFEDAFALALAKDEKLRSIFTPKNDVLGDYGSMPSQPSAVDKDGNVRLTPEQEKVAQNMPGGREAYVNGLKKIQAK